MSSGSATAKLFINYRREDTAPYAGRLYDRLVDHFGQEHVFIDIDQIEPGEDFVEAINRKVGACDIAIVSIGPDWLTVTDAAGNRRLDDPEDFVRMEIVAALQRKIRVIPVLVGGARMPRKQDLPEDLAALSRRNALELSETRFHADVDRLIEAIEKPRTLPEKKTPPAPVPAIAEVPAQAESTNRPVVPPISEIADRHLPATGSLVSSITPFTRNLVLGIGVAIALALLIWSLGPRHEPTTSIVADASPAETPGDSRVPPSIDTERVANPINVTKNAAVPSSIAQSSKFPAGISSIVGGKFEPPATSSPGPEDWMLEIRKSAESGSAEAQFQMGMFYEFGYTGLEADAQEAANWYFKAARQGHGLASEGARDLLADTGSLTEAEAIKKDLRLGARQKAYSDFLSGELDKLHDRAAEAIKNIKGG